MSRIYFATRHGSAEVRGRERALMGMHCSGIFKGVLGVSKYSGDWIIPHLPSDRKWTRPGVYSDRPQMDWDLVDTWLTLAEHNHYLTLDGKRHELFSVELNTVMLAGSDESRLMARLHGQCEIHCWIEAKNIQWFADLVESAFNKKMLRTGQGWEETIPFLRAAKSEVVCSYSVCDLFPYMPSDCKEERWENLSHDDQWSLALADLRQQNSNPDDPTWLTREIKPENFSTYFFGEPISAYTFRDYHWNKKQEVKA